MTEDANFLSRVGPMPAADQPPPPASPPAGVRAAFRLWLAALVVDSIGLVLPYLVSDPYADLQQTALRAGRGRNSLLQSHSYLTALLVMAAVFGTAVIAFRLFLVFKARAGRNWARIVLTVLFGLGVGGGVLDAVFVSVGIGGAGALGGSTNLSLAVGAIALVLEAAAVVLLYRPAANRYFRPPVRLGPAWGYPPPVPPPGWRPLIAPSREAYTSWPVRALSGLVDYGIPTVIFYVFYWPFGSGTYGMGGNQGLLIMLAVIAAVLCFQVWNSAWRQGRTGQSLGKRLTKTWLVDEQTGQPLGFGRAFARLLGHLLDSAMCYVGWLFPLWDRKRQTIADKLVDSVVVTVGQHAPAAVRLGDDRTVPAGLG